ncbi:MAG: hypothetical protein LBS81_02065 [Endomicrobium sp.]|jgi:hypothetical protein|nr:hypothetical protein [Endomicrobium sp.]
MMQKYDIKSIFEFDLKAFENGVQKGNFTFCGHIPEFVNTALQRGVNADMEIFK